jgi:hypothetical protein
MSCHWRAGSRPAVFPGRAGDIGPSVAYVQVVKPVPAVLRPACLGRCRDVNLRIVACVTGAAHVIRVCVARLV